MEESKESSARPQEAARVEQMASTERIPAVTQPPDIERLAKLAAGIVLLLYVTGLLAVNGYLFQLGASDFTLVRTRFIYTGTLIWGSLVVSNIGPILTMINIPGAVKRNIGRPTLAVVIAFIIALFGISLSLSFVIFRGLLNIPPTESPSLKLQVPLVLAISAIGIGVFTWFALTLSRLPPTHSVVEQVLQRLLIGFLIVILAMLYTTIFMLQAYPHIPEQYGGGRPRQVRLLVLNDNKQGLQELGVPFSGKGQLSDPVGLLYEGEEQYILRSPKGHFVRVKKDLILGATE